MNATLLIHTKTNAQKTSRTLPNRYPSVSPNGLRITGERATEGSDPSEARARVRCMRMLGLAPDLAEVDRVLGGGDDRGDQVIEPAERQLQEELWRATRPY